MNLDKRLTEAAKRVRELEEAVVLAREALEIVLHERTMLDANEPVWVLDPAFDICTDALEALAKAPKGNG